MIFVGIDAAKDKHDCFIANSDGEVLFDVFTISNTLDGFNDLLFKIKSVSSDLNKTKVGPETTGHYSYNLLGFLLDNGLTTYSGQLTNCYANMEKRGSKYLRFALCNATKYVCNWDRNFGNYLTKKRSEGKHYNVAISHAAKKLVRLIYALEKSHLPYNPVA